MKGTKRENEWRGKIRGRERETIRKRGERDNKEERGEGQQGREGRGTTRKRGRRVCFFIIKKERERMGGRIREG